VKYLWFWNFWHWSAEGAISGTLLRGPMHGIAGHWDEWFHHEAQPDDIAAIAHLSAQPERQREFIAWLVRRWAPNALWKGERPSARFVLSQLAQLPPFDEWITLSAFRHGYGVRGLSAIVLADGSTGEAGDVRHTEAIAIARDSAVAHSGVVAEGFTAPAAQLSTPRRAVESLLTGRGRLVLLTAWFLGGHRPFPRTMRITLGGAWLLVCALIVVLLVGPDPGAALTPLMSLLIVLWLLLVTIDGSVALVVAAQAWREGRRVRATLDRQEVRLSMPGGLRLIGGSAGLPFALNVLLAASRAAPSTTNDGWLWRRIVRALRTHAPQWAATGGIDEVGRVLPVVLEPKLRASTRQGAITHVLVPKQSGASRAAQERDTAGNGVQAVAHAQSAPPRSPTVSGFTATGGDQPEVHTCSHLAQAVLTIAGLSSRTQRIMTGVAGMASAVLLAATPDIRAILAPAPAPMIVAPFSSTAYALWVNLDGERQRDFWVVLESGFWSNRRVMMQRSNMRSGGPPRAEIPLRRTVR
jgi:hypothetical protein